MRRGALGAGMAATLALPLGAAAAAQTDCRGAPGEVRLMLTIAGVRAAAGVITVTVYPDDPARFLAPRGKVARLRVPAARPATVACLAVPAAGAYALAIYHDEDGDRKFTRSAVGLPAEGYGFSNDASTLLGPPSFAAARFVARAGDNPMAITLKY
ncbi:hypothetical protein STVA_11350 [Allostella vacuolata]|nr:hypothetical protein STVA_11350 [Stella vacuolata]